MSNPFGLTEDTIRVIKGDGKGISGFQEGVGLTYVQSY